MKGLTHEWSHSWMVSLMNGLDHERSHSWMVSYMNGLLLRNCLTQERSHSWMVSLMNGLSWMVSLMNGLTHERSLTHEWSHSGKVSLMNGLDHGLLIHTCILFCSGHLDCTVTGRLHLAVQICVDFCVLCHWSACDMNTIHPSNRWSLISVK